MLALYDLCAVLTPCGPLKALVNAMQEEGSPDMPGLLYEAHLPAGIRKPGSRSTSSSGTNHDDEGRNAIVSQHGTDHDNRIDARLQAVSQSAQRSSFNERSLSSEYVVDNNDTPSSPLTRGRRSSVPLAIAKVYRLSVVPAYGASSLDNISRDIFVNESKVNNIPLLTDANGSEDFYSRIFSAAELCADVEVEFPKNGGRIEKDCTSGKSSRYMVYNGDNQLRRILVVDQKGKVFEETDDENDSVCDEPSSIRLGLGDFIFYSVMVAKAAMYSFTTFAACMLVILSGLGGTLVLLSVYHSALPALPISIFLGVIFYLLTKVLIEPYIEVIMTSPTYV